MVIKHRLVLYFPMGQSRDVSAAGNLNITPLDDTSICIYSEKDMALIIRTANIACNDCDKRAPFHANIFYKQQTALLIDLQVSHSYQTKSNFRRFCCFLNQEPTNKTGFRLDYVRFLVLCIRLDTRQKTSGEV